MDTHSLGESGGRMGAWRRPFLFAETHRCLYWALEWHCVRDHGLVSLLS